MKKILAFISMMLISVMTATAFNVSFTELRSNYILVAVNLLTALLVIVISIGLFKFINITKKNPAFVMAYFMVAMLLLSSVINIFYFFSGSQVSYWIVYLIDRVVILVILGILFLGYKKFRKILSTKI